MEGSWVGVLITIASALAGVLVLLIGIVGNHLSRKIDRKMELKALADEVNRLTNFASQARSFEAMDFSSRVEAVVESVLDYSERNGLSVTKTEIQLMVESSFSVLRALENTGLKLYQLKLSEEHDGKTIKE